MEDKTQLADSSNKTTGVPLLKMHTLARTRFLVGLSASEGDVEEVLALL